MIKNTITLTALLAFVLSFVGTSQALNIGGAIKNTATSTTKGVARSAVANEYNKKLRQETCKFTGDSTTQYTGCDMDKIIQEMNAFRTSAEGSGFANDVNVLVKTSGKDWNTARARAEFLRDKVRSQVAGSWDYSVKYNKGSSNNVYFQVEVH